MLTPITGKYLPALKCLLSAYQINPDHPKCHEQGGKFKLAIDNLSEFYGQNPLAAQLVVHGDSFKDYLIGISVPEPTTFAPMASKLLGRTIAAEDTAALEQACQDERVVAAYLDAYTKIARQNNLKGYEYIKGLYLTMEPFSVENGLLTPAFKVKRHEAVKHFKDQIEAVYAKGPINVSSGRAKL